MVARWHREGQARGSERRDAPPPGGIEQTDTDWTLGATNWCQPVTDIPALPMKGAIDELRIEEVAPGP